MVLAHGVGRVYESPLSLESYLLGGALAVLLAFAIQAFSKDREVREPRQIGTPKLARGIISVAGVVGLAWLLVTIVFIFVEPGRGFTLGPLLFWVAFVVLVVFLSALVAGLWDRANPWITLERLVRVDPDERPGVRPPQWLGPALVYTVFWFELVSTKGFDPGFILLFLALYTVFFLTLRPRYGEYWVEVDPFSILFGFAERSAPFVISEEGVAARSPVAGLIHDKPMPVALFWSVFILMGATTLDNLRETLAWSNFMHNSGLTRIEPMLFDSISLLLFAVPFLLPYLATAAIATKWNQKEMTFYETARTYGWSLAPIGVAYVLAHNMSLLIVGGPLIVQDLFGAVTSNALESYEASPKLAWFLEIAVIVIGHILGVVSAHRIAQRLTADNRAAVKSHVALAILMSIFTMATLYLLSQPLVRA